MQHVAFGSTGEMVSPLGIGSLPVDLGYRKLLPLYENLLDAGCNLVDTAAIYDSGQHESFIGKGLSHRRDDFFLVTKCGHHGQDDDGKMFSLPISMVDIDNALKRLRTEHIDAMLLHSYDLEPLQTGEALGVLHKAREQGKIRWVGYSGDNERADWAVRHGEIQVLECSFSIADQYNRTHALGAARERGVASIAKKPIAAAMWSFVGRETNTHPSNRPYIERLSRMKLEPEEFGCQSMAELALRFSISHVECAIVSSTSLHRQEENLKAATLGPLSEATCNVLEERFQEAELHSPTRPWLGCN